MKIETSQTRLKRTNDVNEKEKQQIEKLIKKN
jgi:hypothetical protein